MSIHYRVLSTPAGYVGFIAGPRGLQRVYLPTKTRAGVERRVRDDHPDATENARLVPGLAKALRRYFAGQAVRFDVRLDCRGATDFQVDVWHACRGVRYGQTASYADLAQCVGRPGAARAVGAAMARNRFPIVVPCHRILRRDGGLGGYSAPGGVAFKRKLLALEAAAQHPGCRRGVARRARPSRVGPRTHSPGSR